MGPDDEDKKRLHHFPAEMMRRSEMMEPPDILTVANVHADKLFTQMANSRVSLFVNPKCFWWKPERPEETRREPETPRKVEERGLTRGTCQDVKTWSDQRSTRGNEFEEV